MKYEHLFCFAKTKDQCVSMNLQFQFYERKTTLFV